MDDVEYPAVRMDLGMVLDDDEHPVTLRVVDGAVGVLSTGARSPHALIC
jgi:hypothetical protein